MSPQLDKSENSEWLDAQPVDVGSSNLLFLNDPESLWIMASGHMDLFMVHLRDGEPFGARHHVARFEQGEAVFGVDPAIFTKTWTFAGGIAPGTEVLRVSRRKLFDGSIHRAGDACKLLERWITGLSAAASRNSEPRGYLALTCGQEVAFGKEPKPVLAREGVVWVKHLEGGGSFLGNSNVPAIPGGRPFPLAGLSWIQEAPSSKLVTLSTEQAIADDSTLSLLEEFHRIVFAYISWNEHAQEERERQRLLLKQKGESSRLDLSLRKLTAPLVRGAENLRLATETESPLLIACEEIGTHLNIEFRPHPDMLRGLPVRDPVAALAKSSGIRFRRVALGLNWWTNEGGSLLGFRERDSRPLALIPKGRSYEVFDPVEGTRVPVNDEIIASLEPFAYTFYRAFPAKPITAGGLLLFGLRGNWRETFLIVLMGILGGLLSMATPILTRSIFDTIIPGAQRQRLLEMGVFLLSSSIASVMFQLTRGFAVLRLEGKMESAVQSAVWDRLLSLPVPFFRQFTAGDLATRGLAISSMRQILTGSAMSSLFSGIFSIFSFCLLFYYSWRLAIAGLILTLIALGVTALCGYFQIRQQRELTTLHGKIAGTVLQFIMGISKFRVSGTENRAFMGWAGLFARQKVLTLKSQRVASWLTIFNAVFPVVSMMAIFWTMAYLMQKKDSTGMTTGEFLAFNSAYGQFSSSMLQLTSVFLSMLAIVPMYERAKPILHALPEVDASKAHAGELSGRIEINHVSFRYREDGPLVLKDVSATINPGEFVAFVGPSGSGKSTMFRMLLGFEVPETGAVYFDGQELSKLDIQSVRQQMGVVMQNASLFSGDIFSNIICSAPYTIDDAWEAAKLAGLDKDLQKMPMGMHTIIGDGGAGLSGGQRQRLMIARAIVGKPRILLFDEATSALDNQTQAIVSKSLQDLKSTRVVIAHRLSTIVNADRIFVVHNGSIVQQGTYEELIGQEGLFAELAKRQLT